MEKQEALNILRRNVINELNIRAPGHLPSQPESARSGQEVRFFHFEPVNMVHFNPIYYAHFVRYLQVKSQIIVKGVFMHFSMVMRLFTLAAALEVFLIDKLNPKRNSIHKSVNKH